MSEVDRLYADHREGVLRYLRRVVGGGEAALDLTQEVFLRAARSGVPDTTDVGRRAWIFKIARNHALNNARDASRRPASVELDDAATPATQELAVALTGAISALAPVDRDIFLLRETAGLRYDEIAAACDLTVEAVRSRLHQARRTLRETLGPELDVRAQRGVKCTTAGRRP